jgi:hypothetical protein
MNQQSNTFNMMSKEEMEKMIEQHHRQNIAERITFFVPTTLVEERNESNVTVVTNEDDCQGRTRSDSLTTVDSTDSNEESNLGTTRTSWVTSTEGTNSVFRNIPTNTITNSSCHHEEDSKWMYTNVTEATVNTNEIEDSFNTFTSYYEEEEVNDDVKWDSFLHDNVNLHIGSSSNDNTHNFTEDDNITLLGTGSFDPDNAGFSADDDEILYALYCQKDQGSNKDIMFVEQFNDNFDVLDQQSTNQDGLLDCDPTINHHPGNKTFHKRTVRSHADNKATKSKLVKRKKVVSFDKKSINKDYKATKSKHDKRKKNVLCDTGMQCTNKDVLCGRGRAINEHPGNVVFRELAKQFRTNYKAPETTCREKREIAQEFVNMTKVDGAKFLKMDNGVYKEVHPDDVLSKAKQVLRESPEDGAKKREIAKEKMTRQN